MLFPIVIEVKNVDSPSINIIQFKNYIETFLVIGADMVACKTLLLQLGGNIMLIVPYGAAVPFFIRNKKFGIILL